MRRSSTSMAMLDSGLPRRPPGNTNVSSKPRISARMASAAADNGTRCLGACLHPLGRYGPDPSLHVDLGPAGAQRLTRACGRQDREGHQLRGDARLLGHRLHERRHLLERQGRMVLDLPDLGPLRQQVLKVPLPAGRVLAAPVTASRCPIEHGLNAPPHPCCRLGLRGPDRLQRLHHQAGIDRLHWQVAEDRVGVGCQRGGPLRCVLVVASAGLVSLDVALGACAEGDRLRGRYNGVLAPLAPHLNRIDALEAELPAGQRLAAGLGERERVG